MIAQSFKYESPGTLAEAISMLNQYGEDAKVLSGGHSLLPLMKLRLANPEYLIDINGIPGLDYIQEDGAVMKIGALNREADIEHSELLKKYFPISHGFFGGKKLFVRAVDDAPCIDVITGKIV